MSKIITLEDVRNTNEKIDKDLEFYQARKEKLELRLSMAQRELDQTLWLIDVLEKERNK